MRKIKDIQLTEKDLHCLARLIQNSFQAPEQGTIETDRRFYGCMYCKYAVTDCNTPEKINWKSVFKKLNELTGIPLSTHVTAPEDIGRVFLPESHYVKHPEDIRELERIHDPETVEQIKAWLNRVITRSREESGFQ